MLRRGQACQRAKAEGGIDEKGVSSCGDSKRGTARQGGQVWQFFRCGVSVSPNAPPGHVSRPKKNEKYLAP